MSRAQLDLLDYLALWDSPATDTLTGLPVGSNDRCPVCNQVAYGSCADPHGVRTTVRTAKGWHVTSRCRCGRLAYDHLQVVPSD